MNIDTMAKFFIDKNTDSMKIASKIATILISFNSNSVIIDYKIYDELKKLAIETQNVVLPEDIKILKIKSQELNAIFYVSTIDSNYLSIDKFFNLTSKPFCYEKACNTNNCILIKMSP